MLLIVLKILMFTLIFFIVRSSIILILTKILKNKLNKNSF